jgi:hypothetical protein
MFVVSTVNGAPGTIRTSDPQIRSLMLYPAELRVLGGVLISGGAQPRNPQIMEIRQSGRFDIGRCISKPIP